MSLSGGGYSMTSSKVPEPNRKQSCTARQRQAFRSGLDRHSLARRAADHLHAGPRAVYDGSAKDRGRSTVRHPQIIRPAGVDVGRGAHRLRLGNTWRTAGMARPWQLKTARLSHLLLLAMMLPCRCPDGRCRPPAIIRCHLRPVHSAAAVDGGRSAGRDHERGARDSGMTLIVLMVLHVGAHCGITSLSTTERCGACWACFMICGYFSRYSVLIPNGQLCLNLAFARHDTVDRFRRPDPE